MTLLAKETGGTSHTWEGAVYDWPAEDPVCEVPPEFAHVLLSIRGADFREVLPEPDDGTGDDTEGTDTAKTPRKAAAKTA